MTATPHRTLVAALAVIALAATLTACTSDDEPQPTPTPTAVHTATSTPTPTLSEQDQNIADAKDAYLTYVAAYDAAAQAGFVDRDLTLAAFELTSADAREAIVSIQAAFEQNGLVQTGSSVVKALEASEYREDTTGAGMHAVTLRSCLDLTATDTVRGGVSTEPTDQYNGPRYVYVQMQRQVAGNWTVASEDPRPEEHC